MSLEIIQKQIDNKTLDPSRLSREQRVLIDEAIKRGLLKGPTMGQLQLQRGSAATDVAIMSAAEKDPIGTQLQLEDSAIKGRNSAILGGDITGSITPYVLMRKKYLVLQNLKCLETKTLVFLQEQIILEMQQTILHNGYRADLNYLVVRCNY